MLDINIDDFYHDIAATLITLYQQFPRKVSLYVEDISGPDAIDEFGLHSNRHLSCIGALMWLHDEGYIRYSDVVHQESVEDCTLTQKVFSKLIRPQLTDDTDTTDNAANRQKSTLAHQLHSALMQQSSINIRTLIDRHLMG